MCTKMFTAGGLKKGSVGFEGRIWDLIVSDPDHCLSFYFTVNTPIFFT